MDKYRGKYNFPYKFMKMQSWSAGIFRKTGSNICSTPKSKYAGCIAILLAFAVFTGCSAREAGREEINSGGKKITVLSDKSTVQEVSHAAADSLDAEKIDRYEGIRGEDWLSDDSILITKENSKLEPVSVSDQMSTIRNLYSYDLKTKEEKSIFKEEDFIWKAVVSPDRTHIFAMELGTVDNTGMISDLDGSVKAQIKDDAEKAFRISFNSARWVNNEEVIAPSSKDGVSLINLNSGISMIDSIGRMQTDDAVKAGNEIYYVSTERELVAYNIGIKQDKAIKSGVLNFELSPDKELFAIEKKVDKNREALVLAGLDGTEKATLAEAKMIFGISWSPDQTKLAYVIISEDDSKSGLYITDLASGKSIYISADYINMDGSLRWSPSGKKILASISEVKDMKLIDNTYIITLK